jgi:hypothetical protein
MDVTTATAEIRARLQELTADFWTDAEVLRALNEGVRRFNAEERWSWLYTVVGPIAVPANTPTLALQEGVSVNRQFDVLVTFSGDTRPRALRRVGPAEGQRLRTLYTTGSSEGESYFLYSEADPDSDGLFTPTIRFVPVINRAFSLEYQYLRSSPPLVNGTDVLDVPEEYAMGPVAWATGNLWLKELRYSAKAEEQFTLYAQVLDAAKRDQRKFVLDSGFAWGRNAPELFSVDEETAVRLRIPPTLG